MTEKVESGGGEIAVDTDWQAVERRFGGCGIDAQPLVFYDVIKVGGRRGGVTKGWGRGVLLVQNAADVSVLSVHL